MPGTPTTNYALPTVVTGDQPHGPNQLTALAQAVDTALLAVDTQRVYYSQGKAANAIPSASVTGMGAPAASGGFGAGTNGPQVPSAGVYICVFTAAFNVGLSGRSFIELSINNAGGFIARSSIDSGEGGGSVTGIYLCAANDEFSARIFQSTGGVVNVTDGTWRVSRISK